METLESLQNNLLANLRQVIDYAEENNLTNTKEFLDFLDIVNELSVSH